MERLTVKAHKILETAGIKYSLKYSDKGFELLNKLGEYEDAEEQGLLLRLPCKVGQTVYAFAYTRTNITVVVEEEVEKILVWENGMSIETDGGYYPLDEIGVYVFLTKEEAEATLAKMKEGV